MIGTGLPRKPWDWLVDTFLISRRAVTAETDARFFEP